MDLKLNKYLIAVSLMVGTSQANAVAYTFTDLGFGFANAINNSGQVVGYSYTTDYYGVVSNLHATMWSAGTVTDLGTLGGTQSNAFAINDVGQVVGRSLTSVAGVPEHATLWNGGTITDLGTLGGNYSSAFGINNAGQVVGVSSTSDEVLHGAFWSGGTVTNMGGYHLADINNIGQAVGASGAGYGGYSIGQATMWSGGTMTDLGSLGVTVNEPTSVNDVGQVVGYSLGVNFSQHATEWINGVAIDLGALDGLYSYAGSINNAGQVVGASSISGGYAYSATLWNNTKIIDLNSLLDATSRSEGWVLWQATGINDKGQIVGIAINTKTNASDAFLLTEVATIPEPSTIFLLCSGFIGLVGFNRRKPASG